jgi:DNA repair protein RadD
VRTTAQLIADGYLAPYDIYAASEPDMEGAALSRGEWTDKEAASRSMPIIGDVVSEYLKHGQGKKFIAFGVNVAHCEEIQRQMMAAGVVCGLYTYHTTDAEREDMLKEFAKRDSYLQGLVSVSALAKGFDNPAVEVVILARPLRKSLAEHIQQLGRGLRRDPENPAKRCIVLDHSGNTVRFYAQMMDFFEHGARELDDGRKKEAKKKEAKEREPMKCPACAYVHDPRPMCPMCGHEHPKRQSQVEHVAGTLSKLTGLVEGSIMDRQSFYSQLLSIAHRRGYADGWAAHKYRARFDAWPDGLQKIEVAPTSAVERWVRSEIIRFAKGRKRGAA